SVDSASATSNALTAMTTSAGSASTSAGARSSTSVADADGRPRPTTSIAVAVPDVSAARRTIDTDAPAVASAQAMNDPTGPLPTTRAFMPRPLWGGARSGSRGPRRSCVCVGQELDQMPETPSGRSLDVPATRLRIAGDLGRVARLDPLEQV